MKINYTTIYFKNKAVFMERHGLVQYEYGQYLELHEILSDKTILKGEFYNFDNEEVCYPMEVKKENDLYYVRVPDELLKNTDDIICYICDETEESKTVLNKILLRIEERPEGEEYTSEENKELLGELLDTVNEMFDTLPDVIDERIVEMVDNQGFLENYYTKNEVDHMIPDTSMYALKSEMITVKASIPTKTSQLLNDSGYITQHQDISNLATKTELKLVEEKIPSTENFATKNQLADVEAKIQEAPIKTSQLINDSGFLTEHQDISNLASKSELQSIQEQIPDVSNFTTKTYVDTEIAKINGVEYIQLTELPEQPLEGHKAAFYLIPNEGQANNLFDEYIWYGEKWELFGTTKIDLSDYYTKKEVIELIPDTSNLASKTEVQAVEAKIPTVPTNISAFNNDSGYLTEHQDISNLATKNEVADVEAKIPSLEGYATTTYVDNVIGDIEALLAEI